MEAFSLGEGLQMEVIKVTTNFLSLGEKGVCIALSGQVREETY